MREGQSGQEGVRSTGHLPVGRVPPVFTEASRPSRTCRRTGHRYVRLPSGNSIPGVHDGRCGTGCSHSRCHASSRMCRCRCSVPRSGTVYIPCIGRWYGSFKPCRDPLHVRGRGGGLCTGGAGLCGAVGMEGRGHGEVCVREELGVVAGTLMVGVSGTRLRTIPL